MEDSRQKYQLNIALANGQAFEIVTTMPLEAVRSELQRAATEEERAVFDGMNPFTDDKVTVEVYTHISGQPLIAGFIHRPWHRPPPAPPQPMPRLM